LLAGQVNPDKRARAAFWDARFLALATILGTGCTASYYVSGGSLLAAAFTHWLPVNLWLFLLVRAPGRCRQQNVQILQFSPDAS
jgi:predicted Abi (CAAX) family protease